MGKSVLEEHFLNKSMKTVPINPNATSFSKIQNIEEPDKQENCQVRRKSWKTKQKTGFSLK